jgi:hypothetical protein
VLPKDGIWFDLDKAWADIDAVLRTMPPPLDRAIAGDIPPEERSPEDTDATSLSFVTPKMVAEIAQALDPIEPAFMIELIIDAGLMRTDDEEFDKRYYADYFEHLKEAYRTAAREGSGLGVLFC